jgi:hypothetical protein
MATRHARIRVKQIMVFLMGILLEKKKGQDKPKPGA